ncbi:MAG: cation diffusion facilitator family transporter [Actinomycetota bacterium]|nr:cation diffusion facilitator family transporter [Actinomycetota bacterium]
MAVTATSSRADRDRSDRADANRAVGVSALGLLLTGAAELVLALVTGSVGLLGDALHNLSDVSTSVVVFLGLKISKKAPTDRYPYGYERAEDLAGLLIALVIWASAALAGYASYRKLVGHSPTSNVYLGMAGAILGIIGNQIVARYKHRVGTRINSATLVADAKHSWLDALSSVGALLGLILVALGYRWGDPIAGFAVTLFIVHVGYEVTKDVTHHLMDGIDDDELKNIHEALADVPGLTVQAVRGRWLGRSLYVDVQARLSPNLTVADIQTLQAAERDAVLIAVPAARELTLLPAAG